MDYSPLAPLPILVGGNSGTDPATFFGNLVPLIIAVAGALAVLRVMYGGIIYLTTDAWGGKEDAKKIIRNALFGLLLAIGSYAILFTISPNLVRITLAPTPQNAGGEALNPDDLNNGGFGNEGAEETGCTNNCVVLNSAEITVTPGACINNPCYINSNLLSGLEDLKGLRYQETYTERGEERTRERLLVWQVIKAYPQTAEQAGDLACYKPGEYSGNCLEVSVANTSNIIVSTFIRNVHVAFGPDFQQYNACPNSRRDAIKQLVGGSPELQGKIVCFPTLRESAFINR